MDERRLVADVLDALKVHIDDPFLMGQLAATLDVVELGTGFASHVRTRSTDRRTFDVVDDQGVLASVLFAERTRGVTYAVTDLRARLAQHNPAGAR